MTETGVRKTSHANLMMRRMKKNMQKKNTNTLLTNQRTEIALIGNTMKKIHNKKERCHRCTK